MNRLILLLSLQGTLWALVSAVGITPASPQPTLTPNSTSTCPISECWFVEAAASQLFWETITPTSTIVAATVRIIINNGTNATATTTIFNTLPDGIKLPQTNEAGTQIVVMTSFAATGGVATIAYPSRWADYDSIVIWSGILSTNSICSTNTFWKWTDTITLPPHTPIPESKLYELDPISTDPADPQGLHYLPSIKFGFPVDYSSYATQLQEDALASCSAIWNSPLVQLDQIRFLTETETSWATPTAEPVLINGEPTDMASPIVPVPTPPIPGDGPEQQPADPTATPGGGPHESSKFNPGANAAALTPAVLTIGGTRITAVPGQSNPVFVIGSQTLTPGGRITVSGTTVELKPTAPVVVIDGETSTLETQQVSTDSKKNPTSTGSELQFTGAAASSEREPNLALFLGLGLAMFRQFFEVI